VHTAFMRRTRQRLPWLHRARGPELDDELYPRRRVVAGAFPAAHLAVDAAALELAHEIFAEEEVIEAQARVPLPAVPHVVPERIERRLVRIEPAQRVGPALLEQRSIGGAGGGLHQ